MFDYWCLKFCTKETELSHMEYYNEIIYVASPADHTFYGLTKHYIISVYLDLFFSLVLSVLRYYEKLVYEYDHIVATYSVYLKK